MIMELKIMSAEKTFVYNVNELCVRFDYIVRAISVISFEHILTGTASEESGKVA
jgi:hypothetical protein